MPQSVQAAFLLVAGDEERLRQKLANHAKCPIATLLKAPPHSDVTFFQALYKMPHAVFLQLPRAKGLAHIRLAFSS